MTREDINNIISTICPNDEDFEKPIISPAYLKKELEALALEQEPKAGWIPVSERLPEISEKDVNENTTFSKTVLSCQKYGNGFICVGIDEYTTNNNGGWLSEVPFDDPNERCKVIAWMPLPEPYKEG